MPVPIVGLGCFFEFQISLLRAVFELLNLELLCHVPVEARQILTVTKYDLGEVWDSLGLFGVLSSTVGWRCFNILISFIIKISSNCGKKGEIRASLPPVFVV